MLGALPAFDFFTVHRDDLRLLNNWKAQRAHNLGDRLGLIRLNIENENVRLLISIDRLKMREQNFTCEKTGE